MAIKRILCLIVILVSAYEASSQNVISGKVLDKLYDRVVIGATISNLSQGKTGQSDMGGNYKIPANAGDILSFSSIGYTADTIVVASDMLADPLNVYLVRNVVTLEEVQVGELNAYQVDSINRREEFEDVLTKRNTKLVGGKGNAPTDGFGVAFSPITFFSKKEKNERQFKKMFEQQEEELYVDYKFPYDYIGRTTGLQGDSLRSFMLTYRPDYDFCRRNNREGMLVYINDSYREFTHKKTVKEEMRKKEKEEK